MRHLVGMFTSQSSTRLSSKAGKAIGFAVLIAVLVVVVPALLWPLMLAAGLTLVWVAVSGRSRTTLQRAALAVLGALLILCAVVPFIDLATFVVRMQ